MGISKRIISKPLGELLLERGIINKKQLENALQVQKEKGGMLGGILVLLGYAKEEEIAQALTTQYGFPYLPLDSYQIDPEVVKIIPENVCRHYCLVPIDKIGNTLTITISNPLNTQAVEDIEYLAKCDIQIFVSTMSAIKRAIDANYPKEKEKKT